MAIASAWVGEDELVLDVLLLGRVVALGVRKWGLLLQTVESGLSVGHANKPCTSGWTDRYAVWDVHLVVPKEPCSRWQTVKGQYFDGEKGPVQSRTYPAVGILKATHQGAEPVRCGCRLRCTRCGCTLAPPGEYDWPLVNNLFLACSDINGCISAVFIYFIYLFISKNELRYT